MSWLKPVGYFRILCERMNKILYSITFVQIQIFFCCWNFQQFSITYRDVSINNPPYQSESRRRSAEKETSGLSWLAAKCDGGGKHERRRNKRGSRHIHVWSKSQSTKFQYLQQNIWSHHGHFRGMIQLQPGSCGRVIALDATQKLSRSAKLKSNQSSVCLQ